MDQMGTRDADVRDILGGNKIVGTNWTLEFAPDDDEYVGDEPVQLEPVVVEEWRATVEVELPDGRRIVQEAWFPKATMSPRQVGEHLQLMAENVRSRVNSLP